MTRLLRWRLPLVATGLLLAVALPMILLNARPDDAQVAGPDTPLDRLAETIAPSPVSAQEILHALAARPAAEKVQPALRQMKYRTKPTILGQGLFSRLHRRSERPKRGSWL